MAGKSSKTRASLNDPKTMLKVFVGMRNEEGSELVAYVCSYDADEKKYLLTYPREEREDSHVELNESNCRILSDNDVRKLIAPQGIKRTLEDETRRLKLKSQGKPPPKKRKSERLEKKAKEVPEDTTLSRNRGLVGICVLIRIKSKRPRQYALIVGFRAPSTHKLFFLSDKHFDTMDLKDFEWLEVPRTMTPWDSESLVGCRIYAIFSTDKFEVFYGPKTKRIEFDSSLKPHEAYVVQHITGSNYKIFITCHDVNLDVDLEEVKWGLLDRMSTTVNETPIVMWK